MLLNRWQTTLRNPVHFMGKGLHSGRMVSMIVEPADINTGIRFLRSDLAYAEPIAALAHQVKATQLCTTLGHGPNTVATIEHLMAALAGLGISNALIRLDAPEVPIMDGSSCEFVEGIMEAGLIEQAAPALVFRLKESFEYREGDKYIRLHPAQKSTVQCNIDFDNPLIGKQSMYYEASLDSFLSISKARTFCYLRDVEAMREQGLALGGGLDNAVVVSDKAILNKEGLRSHDEFVQHKLLDLIGDFALLGAPLLARIEAYKSGHALHAKAMNALLKESARYLEAYVPEQNSVFSAHFASSAKPAAALFA